MIAQPTLFTLSSPRYSPPQEDVLIVGEHATTMNGRSRAIFQTNSIKVENICAPGLLVTWVNHFTFSPMLGLVESLLLLKTHGIICFLRKTFLDPQVRSGCSVFSYLLWTCSKHYLLFHFVYKVIPSQWSSFLELPTLCGTCLSSKWFIPPKSPSLRKHSIPAPSTYSPPTPMPSFYTGHHSGDCFSST